MLTKVNIIGDKYVHVFQNALGEIYEVETTKEDYDQLATPGHVDPTPPEGFVWANSHSRKKYDTPSGDLEDNQYADYGLVHVKVAGKDVVQVESTKVINDELSTDVVLKDESFTKADMSGKI